MENELFAKLLGHKGIKEVPLSYVIIVFSAVQDIEQLKTVYPEIPTEMQEEWDRSHAKFIEKAAWIKQMQAM